MAEFGRSFCVAAVLLSIISSGAYGNQSCNFALRGKPVDLEDSDIADILNTHNQARSNVFPLASDMHLLVWNEDLAAAAWILSQNCSLDSTQDKTLGKPFKVVGTSFLVFDILKPNYSKAIFDFWMRSGLAYYNYEEDTCFFTGICTLYKQTIWAKTKAVGCGASKCRTITRYPFMDSGLLYCLYGPPGNIPGERPYETGVPCSRCMPGQVCENNLCGDPQCDHEVILGVDNKTVAMVNTTVSTCFTCFNQSNMPAEPPIMFYINGIKNMVIPNADIKYFRHRLYVTNFTSLTKLVDGSYNQFECTDGNYSLFRRTVVTLNPVQPQLMFAVPEFYEEGSDLRIACINTNLQLYTGKTYWIYFKNEPVGKGGDLNIKNITRCQAGLYTCGVKLDIQTPMAKIPTRSIEVIVHYPPDVITNHRSLETFKIGVSFTLLTSFSGLPLPSVKWIHNGLTLNNINGSINIITIASDVSTGLSMLQWLKPSVDAVGVVSFVATNNLGNNSVTITLSLLP